MPDDLAAMIEENLIAERIAIDSYREIINYVGDRDTTTKRMLEGILAVEEEHAEDMKTLMEDFGKKGEPAKPGLEGRASATRNASKHPRGARRRTGVRAPTDDGEDRGTIQRRRRARDRWLAEGDRRARRRSTSS